MTTTDHLIARLRAADPIDLGELVDADPDEFLTSLPDRLDEVGARRTARNRRRGIRFAAIAGAAAMLILAVPVVAPHIGRSRGQNQPALAWLPNAAADELDVLARTATGAPTTGYIYSKEVRKSLGVQFTSPDNPFARWWDARTIERWQGTTCQDREVQTVRPYQFLTAADRTRYERWANQPSTSAADRAAPKGSRTEWTAAQLWDKAPAGEPANPCDRAGSYTYPTPTYAASLPTEPIALLDRLAADAGTLPGVPPQEVGEPLLRILTLPWLTEQQRRAAIEAVGLLPGAWKVTGHSTINGAPALTIAYDEGGIRSEITLAGTLPGIWSARKTLIDPLKASAESSGTFDGLAPGTVILDQHVTAATAVASNTATP